MAYPIRLRKQQPERTEQKQRKRVAFGCEDVADAAPELFQRSRRARRRGKEHTNGGGRDAES